jgi:hypothetical protein
VPEEEGVGRVVIRSDEGADVSVGARSRVVRMRCEASAPTGKRLSQEQMRYGGQDWLCYSSQWPTDGTAVPYSKPVPWCRTGSKGPLGLTGVGHDGDAAEDETCKAERFRLLSQQLPAVVQQLLERGRLSAPIHQRHDTRSDLAGDLLVGSYPVPSLAKKLCVLVIQLDRTQKLSGEVAPSSALAMCAARESAAQRVCALSENPVRTALLRTHLKQPWNSSSSYWYTDKCLGGRP